MSPFEMAAMEYMEADVAACAIPTSFRCYEYSSGDYETGDSGVPACRFSGRTEDGEGWCEPCLAWSKARAARKLAMHIRSLAKARMKRRYLKALSGQVQDVAITELPAIAIPAESPNA